MAVYRFLVLVALSSVWGRTQPAFEVASVKPANPNANATYTRTDAGRLTLENISLKDCIERAFEVKDFSLSAPPWLDSARFDIVAKAPERAKIQQFNVMLQKLIIDRFKLAFHRETRVMPAYALVVDKKGLRVQAVEPGNSGWSTGRGMLDGIHLPMTQFASLLAERVDRPVKDLTGLSGIFDIKLRWTPEGTDPSAVDPSLPTSILTALQEQAGLKLEPQRLPVEILVVDYIERQPTEN
jgi:uncharacterized protein (TIGR03435 family)